MNRKQKTAIHTAPGTQNGRSRTDGQTFGQRMAALRTAPRVEGVGLDVTQHGEEAYASGEGSILVIPDAVPAGAPAPALTPQAAAR